MKGAWFALTAILRYLLTGYCGSIGCCYVEPYGFVPEAGCPVHDADTCLSRWARKARGEQQGDQHATIHTCCSRGEDNRLLAL